MSNPSLYFSIIFSPMGYWRINADENHITSIELVPEKSSGDHPNPHTLNAAQQLIEYFEGSRTEFDLPLKTSTYSDFYQAVWEALESVPFGKTTHYSALAQQIGNPDAVRAVGLANGKNPFPLSS